MQKWAATLWALLFAGLLATLYMAQFVLPEVASTTFGLQNEVSGRMPKDVFVFFFLGVSSLVNLLLFSIFKSVPQGVMFRLANLPRKEYWLDPSRVHVGLGKLRTIIAGLGAVLNLLWLLVVWFIIEINRGNAIITPTQFVLVAFVLVGSVIGWSYWYARD